MNIGSLYQVKKHSWLLFPTKETNVHAHRHVVDHTCVYDDNENAAWWAARYSRKYNCNVTWFSPGSFVVFIEEDGKFKKFLTSEGLIGWTRLGEHESYNKSFEEVKP
jgi:hypothetical protein